ncbi:glycosyltransferase family 2 protein [Phenylobacterium sp.]|jgi:GT2 family glycosyltransferase|uniref:glycosyltransferase family 2 protein n=1 Tax=Phenylobacterium sp. TaxID=1871053 RepID=UPI002F943A0B
MDELTLSVLTRTADAAFSAKRAANARLVLFGRPERYVIDAPVEASAVAALQVAVPSGARFRLHRLVIRRKDGADLYRWAGAGELLRESRGLRFATADGAVRVEAVADGAGFTVGLDPAISGEALQVLLTLSGDASATPATPDRIAQALDHLLARLQTAEDDNRRLTAAAARHAEQLEALRAESAQQLDHLTQLRTEEGQRHEALNSILHHRLEVLNAVRAETAALNDQLTAALRTEQARATHTEAQAAALRQAVAAHQSHLHALLGSSSWRLTGPVRWLARLLTGRRVVPLVLPQVPDGAAPAEPLEPQPPPRPPPHKVAFPAPGDAAVIGELAPQPPPPLDVTVSVIIPTYNAGPEFYWLLRKLKAQKGLGGVEIVVVDSGSVDGTDTLAEEFGCTVVRIPNSEFSHSHARNLGADNATGELYLFTVQDAYPVGDWWLHSLAVALTEPASEEMRAAAVSCSEFPRRDSELLYNAAIDTHYRFLGCRDRDRIGEMITDDHMSLRAQGQLSDVACMIPAGTFHKYRYHGRYAEDLMLGVRLLRDGLKTAMLSSVRVVHSHNRPTAYHLKRTFVDVVFLTEVFPDFEVPAARSAAGAATGAALLAPLAEAWRPAIGADATEELRTFSAAVRAAQVGSEAAAPVDFGFAPLAPWLAKAIRRKDEAWRAEAEQVRNMYADRLDHLAGFVTRTYGEVDEHLANELSSAARKTLAATVGAQLAFLYLHVAKAGPKPDARLVEELRTLMTAGI